MYHPYFRGKQYELIAIRECASLLKSAGFSPIIEPVKQATSGLKKTLQCIVDANAKAIVIVNPFHGELSGNTDVIADFIANEFNGHDNIRPAILLTEETSIEEVKYSYQKIKDFDSLVFIHAGYKSPQLILDEIISNPSQADIEHVFHDKKSGKLYRRHFKKSHRVLLRDGFEKTSNRKYPEVESFSELHVTFEDEGMDGFGDFLTVGDEYSETGGPAYAVAIHITFIDKDKDDEMHIHHFKSIRQDDPKDPAGKFAEALHKLIAELNKPDCKIFNTEAIKEFRDLHSREHFPGLGYVKKLSMKHHLETLAKYFE